MLSVSNSAWVFERKKNQWNHHKLSSTMLKSAIYRNVFINTLPTWYWKLMRREKLARSSNNCHFRQTVTRALFFTMNNGVENTHNTSNVWYFDLEFCSGGPSHENCADIKADTSLILINFYLSQVWVRPYPCPNGVRPMPNLGWFGSYRSHGSDIQ